MAALIFVSSAWDLSRTPFPGGSPREHPLSRTVVRSSRPELRTSLRRRVRPASLRLTDSRLPDVGALGAALIALTVVAVSPVGSPASPAVPAPSPSRVTPVVCDDAVRGVAICFENRTTPTTTGGSAVGLDLRYPFGYGFG